MEISQLNDTPSTTVSINGAHTALTAPTLEALRSALRAAGVVTFVAVVNGQEVADPNMVVAGLEEGANVEIRTYAKPGADT